MIPLVNRQTQIKFNYINKPYNQISQVFSPAKQSKISLQSGIRPNQQQKYVLEMFQSLKLQTKNSLPTDKNLNSKKIISPKKQNYNAYQSLHKGEQLQPVLQTPSINTSIPTLHAQQNKEQQKKYNFTQIPAMRQSEFMNQQRKRSGSKVVNYSNNKTVTSQQLVKNILQYNQSKGNNYEHLSFIQNQNSQVYRGSQSLINKKRNSRQIKTFKYENIPQQKQDNFNNCCGFGMADKIAFRSKQHA